MIKLLTLVSPVTIYDGDWWIKTLEVSEEQAAVIRHFEDIEIEDTHSRTNAFIVRYGERQQEITVFNNEHRWADQLIAFLKNETYVEPPTWSAQAHLLPCGTSQIIAHKNGTYSVESDCKVRKNPRQYYAVWKDDDPDKIRYLISELQHALEQNASRLESEYEQIELYKHELIDLLKHKSLNKNRMSRSTNDLLRALIDLGKLPNHFVRIPSQYRVNDDKETKDLFYFLQLYNVEYLTDTLPNQGGREGIITLLGPYIDASSVRIDSKEL